MNWRLRKKSPPVQRTDTADRLRTATAVLVREQEKHDEESGDRMRLVKLLQENHLAQKMYNELQARQ